MDGGVVDEGVVVDGVLVGGVVAGGWRVMGRVKWVVIVGGG